MTDVSVTYDPSSDTYRTDFVLAESDSAADAIVVAIAEIEDVDPNDLEPLNQIVDTDALGAVFRSGGEHTSPVSVAFEYAGFLVTARNDETITFETLE